MIEHLKLVITSEELKTLVEGRMKYHAHKAEVLNSEVLRLGGVLSDLDDEAEEIGKYTNSLNTDNGDPVKLLAAKAKVHRDRATYFKFFSEHIISNENYILNQADLSVIEVVGRW